MKIRLIGDCHGAINSFRIIPIEPHCADRHYIKLIDGVDYSVQLGDLGFDYEAINHLSKEQHGVIMGNHDNYDNPPRNSLGDFGQAKLGDFEFYFIRGAYSINEMYLAKSGPDKSWWFQEELTIEQMDECQALYAELKPSVMLTHDCPITLMKGGILASSYKVDNPSRTALFLDKLFSIHQPRWWYFGHWHKNVQQELHGTIFTCISELCYVDIASDGSPLHFPR